LRIKQNQKQKKVVALQRKEKNSMKWKSNQNKKKRRTAERNVSPKILKEDKTKTKKGSQSISKERDRNSDFSLSEEREDVQEKAKDEILISDGYGWLPYLWWILTYEFLEKTVYDESKESELKNE